MSELTLLARLNKRVLHVNIRIGIGVDTDKTLEGHWSESPVKRERFRNIQAESAQAEASSRSRKLRGLLESYANSAGWRLQS
ncbi:MULTISPECIES: hypothetical protein [unclassified Mesorhizobium]|uniref:hypothetical protein n=1 Tax=unclassified Mesorhizobium TaxID=325217 RepID=UPI000FD2713C|nr:MULTISPECIES: hypothetical protein [unclassified Mesorhizobium]RUU85597.1 hypothetical protein EOB59_31560 [Mesorhizobium sp. M7A.F.Ca.MR.176.00.0.0]RVD15348.1 hypothetical protein EN749_16330 [Mesorhizobium sp. M7A.F.Ca.ET.027.02.1.1]RWC96496.1 MAG: hypothetical protein EOS73_33610 [Mesorhizobium sp.]RWO66176.1 MAG: hypothetical protein EOS17_22580 [Mesorhizobium sp.]RWO76047.1 MAG: hypothetical protein EOQ96_33500 [Mesorhizobium sp.]